MSAGKPGRDPRSDRDPEVVCESDPRTDGPNRSRPGSRRRSRTLVAPPTRVTNDRPCLLAAGLEGTRPAQPPIHSADRRPLATRLRRRNSPLVDRTGPLQACEKFLGTTNTVLCYRQTFRSLFCCRKHCLDNMFVTEEAFVVFKYMNNAAASGGHR